ncbi:MAG: hypothetical protein JSV51_05050 [Candidatus Bathyarchaeota archaeon]|nr:MAG: hypothetical protein JSV51_05050 [Candidatus Bathyarchaeota archaeon]
MKSWIAVFILVAIAFTEYYIVLDTLTNIVSNMEFIETLNIMGVFFGGVGIATVIGSIVSNTVIKQEKLMLLWFLLGITSFLLFSITEGASLLVISTISLLLGISIGLGMPSIMAYFADTFEIERRGRFGGTIWFVVGVCISVFALVTITLGPAARMQSLAIFVGIGLLIFLLTKQRKTEEKKRQPKLTLIIRERRILLYVVPWIMFCLINSLEAPILENFFGSDFFSIVPVAELAISSITALIGGFISDFEGRKRVAIIGFVLIGIGYAVLGFVPNLMISWYLYVLVDGIAWGMFVLVFIMVVWGDFGANTAKEKYYLIGGLPFLISWFLQFLIEPNIAAIPVEAAFSLASLFLFIAVVPLMFAPETLPEKKLEKRRLKKYAETARKLKEKLEGNTPT